MKTTCSITVRGKDHEWSFSFKANPEHIEAWRADGLDVAVVLYRIPYWAHQMGLTRVWCRAQDVWQLVRLW
jgi:hypothetical protein